MKLIFGSSPLKIVYHTPLPPYPELEGQIIYFNGDWCMADLEGNWEIIK